MAAYEKWGQTSPMVAANYPTHPLYCIKLTKYSPFSRALNYLKQIVHFQLQVGIGKNNSRRQSNYLQTFWSWAFSWSKILLWFDLLVKMLIITGYGCDHDHLLHQNISNKSWYLRPRDPGFVNDTVECWESLIISIIFIIWLISPVIRAVMKLRKRRKINKNPSLSTNWILLMKS